MVTFVLLSVLEPTSKDVKDQVSSQVSIEEWVNRVIGTALNVGIEREWVLVVTCYQAYSVNDQVRTRKSGCMNKHMIEQEYRKDTTN